MIIIQNDDRILHGQNRVKARKLSSWAEQTFSGSEFGTPVLRCRIG